MARLINEEKDLNEHYAHLIRSYWARRGMLVNLHIIEVYPEKHGPNIWGVRSDMVNGMPVKPIR